MLSNALSFIGSWGLSSSFSLLFSVSSVCCNLPFFFMLVSPLFFVTKNDFTAKKRKKRKEPLYVEIKSKYAFSLMFITAVYSMYSNYNVKRLHFTNLSKGSNKNTFRWYHQWKMTGNKYRLDCLTLNIALHLFILSLPLSGSLPSRLFLSCDLSSNDTNSGCGKTLHGVTAVCTVSLTLAASWCWRDKK